jgi:hypothetical protein
MAWISPLLLLIGLIVPGSLLARRVGAAGFLASLLILFHAVYWTGVCHLPITVWTVLPWLIAASGAAAWGGRRAAVPVRPDHAAWSTEDRVLIAVCAAAAAALAARCIGAPLLGVDTRFRWDFLADRMLALRSFSFYPPLTSADFRSYFYPDGIPPLVSFSNWWIYASVGRHAPVVLTIFETAQFAAAVWFVYGSAATLFSRRAGLFAAAMLAACPLFFNATVIEQETGLTTMAVAAMIYFVVTDRPWWAAAAAALCALSREYGWIAPVAGVVALRWRSRPWKEVALFAAMAAAIAGPWYVRNWAMAGNPFYSLHFGPFAVNPVHDAILQSYQATFGWQTWTAEAWLGAFGQLLALATLPIVAGIAGLAPRLRERGYLAVIAALFLLVWLQSAGYTSGGLGNAMRVASPGVAALSIAGAGAIEAWSRRARAAVIAVVVAAGVWTIVQGAVYPDNPLEIGPQKWAATAFPGDGEVRRRCGVPHGLFGDAAGQRPVGDRLRRRQGEIHALQGLGRLQLLVGGDDGDALAFAGDLLGLALAVERIHPADRRATARAERCDQKDGEKTLSAGRHCGAGAWG